MPLNPGELERGFRPIFTNYSTSPAKTAHDIASVIAMYSSKATSCGAGHPVPSAIQAKTVLLEASFTSTFSRLNDIYAYSTDFGNFVATFWAGMPFLGGPNPGIVTLAVPTTLTAGILSILSANQALCSAGGAVAGDKVASQYAKMVHFWTMTVIVTHATVPQCVGPIF